MIEMVDTTAAVAIMLDDLDDLPTHPPSLYLDVEGEDLSRHGTVAVLQLQVLPTNRTYLVDVHTLGDAAFSTPGGNGNGLTLREILEREEIPKVFFDVRNDSDALHALYSVRLAGIQDLQLMELSTRPFSRKFVNGLAKCIERDAGLSPDELTAWSKVKQAGRHLFCNGSYAVFAERPLSNAIRLYCAQDVQILPLLWSRYHRKMDAEWTEKVRNGSAERVAQSQSPTYNGKGRQMALAPREFHVWRLEDIDPFCGEV